MTTCVDDCAMWIDHEYDRAHASNLTSRYGAYVADRIDWFAH
jgi:hypothetical protein